MEKTEQYFENSIHLLDMRGETVSVVHRSESRWTVSLGVRVSGCIDLSSGGLSVCIDLSSGGQSLRVYRSESTLTE